MTYKMWFQMKCTQYWTEETNMPIQYGDITITLEEVKRFNTYTLKLFSLRLVCHIYILYSSVELLHISALYYTRTKQTNT